LAFSLAFPQSPGPGGAGDGNWPREIDISDIQLVIYQPQVDTWKDNRIEARSAVIVTRQEEPAQIFGIVSINARTEVDRETRLGQLERRAFDYWRIGNAVSRLYLSHVFPIQYLL
jgi:hypothetical protein